MMLCFGLVAGKESDIIALDITILSCWQATLGTWQEKDQWLQHGKSPEPIFPIEEIEILACMPEITAPEKISLDITKAKGLTENILLVRHAVLHVAMNSISFLPKHWDILSHTHWCCSWQIKWCWSNSLVHTFSTGIFGGYCSCYGYQSRGWPPSVVEVQSDYTVHCVKTSDRRWGCVVGVSFLPTPERAGMKVLWNKCISMLILSVCKATVFDFYVTSTEKKVAKQLYPITDYPHN